MSTSDLIEEIESSPPDQPLDWPAVSQRLVAEFSAATTPEERGKILAVRAAAIEVVEQQLQLHGDHYEKFVDACELEYKRLIVQESLIDSHISYEKLLVITDREIAAGRMSEDFALREIAKEELGVTRDAENEPASTPSASVSAFERLKHWLHLKA